MPKMTKKRKAEMAFFINEKGRMQYFKKCLSCQKDCKQSFRIKELKCPNYKEKEAK